MHHSIARYNQADQSTLTKEFTVPPVGTLDRVRDASRARQTAEQTVKTTRHNEHEAIRTALEAGYPASALATAAGLSLPRIYQIRDDRR